MLRVGADRRPCVHGDVPRGVDEHTVAGARHVERNGRMRASIVRSAEVIDVQRLDRAALFDGLEVQTESVELLAWTEREAENDFAVEELRGQRRCGIRGVERKGDAAD